MVAEAGLKTQGDVCLLPTITEELHLLKDRLVRVSACCLQL